MYRALTIVCTAAGLGLACSSSTPAELRVSTEYSKTMKWVDMRSFRMASGVPTDTSYTRYPRYERMISDLLVEQLTSRGYIRTEDGPTDFRVSFELVVRGDTSPSAGNSPYGTDALPATAKGSGQVSSLIVRMLDPATAEILWQGTVTGFGLDAVRAESELRKAVWRVLAEFPPLTG